LIAKQGLDAPIERKATHRTWQETEGLKHTPDVVRQSRGHADELRPGSQERAGTVGFEGLDVHRPVPSRAHDLCQAFGVVLVGFVDLHLKSSTGVPSIEAHNVEASTTHLMHQPWRHGTRLDANSCFFASMPAHGALDLTRTERHCPRQSLRPTSSTTQIAVILCDTSNPT
jgi:hypothetical protein